jgi:hypothetical protein
MLRLDKVIKPWKESAALNDHINLYGFWSETAFLTKSGDLGMVLSIFRCGLRESGPFGTEVRGETIGSRAESVWPRFSRLPIPLQIKPPGHPVRKI